MGSIVLKPLRLAKTEDYINCFNLNVMGAIHALKNSENHLKKTKGNI